MSVNAHIRIEHQGIVERAPKEMVPPNEVFTYGRAFARSYYLFSFISRQLSIINILTFTSNEYELDDETEAEVMSEYEESMPELSETDDVWQEISNKIEILMNTRGEWYNPEEGLENIRALIKYINDNPKSADEYLHRTDAAKDLLWDLRAMEGILLEAQKNNRRFRIKIG